MASSTIRPFPSTGSPVDEVIRELGSKKDGDVRWAEGRTFGLVFDGGDEVREVAQRAARLFLHENALNTSAFPSLGEIQSELCGWTAELLHGPAGTAGFLTSGGTESILCAVEAARERARSERSVVDPEIVLAESAHAAFHKGAHLFGLRTRVVPVTDAWTVDLDAMADAIGPKTALVVASAPQYPQGVVDPVAEIAELAASVGASCHVDACMGGFVLPFAAIEDPDAWGSPPWDLAVEGVSTISADLHKLGYAPKGASVILHRSRQLRRYQTFDFDGWLGGRYVTPNLQGTRSACRWRPHGRWSATSAWTATGDSSGRPSKPPTGSESGFVRSTASRCRAIPGTTCCRSPPTRPTGSRSTCSPWVTPWRPGAGTTTDRARRTDST